MKERNWMEVFPWARWGGNDNLPVFTVNQTFMPTELLLKEVRFGPYTQKLLLQFLSSFNL